MRLTDFRDKRVRTLDGETLGRVHDVHVDKGKVTALMVGPGSFIERLTARKGGRRVPWECVRKVDDREIIVTANPPQRKAAAKASASRSRQGTRRPSAKPSRR